MCFIIFPHLKQLENETSHTVSYSCGGVQIYNFVKSLPSKTTVEYDNINPKIIEGSASEVTHVLGHIA